MTETLPGGRCIVAATTTVYLPSRRSQLRWASIRRGIVVQWHRAEKQFSQVSYVERSSIVEPSHVTYQITGWVPTALLARQVARYFYQFLYHGRTPETWPVEIDNHCFLLFWKQSTSFRPSSSRSGGGWICCIGVSRHRDQPPGC